MVCGERCTDHRADERADIHNRSVDGDVAGATFRRAEFEQDVVVAEVDAGIDDVDEHTPRQNRCQVGEEADEKGVTGGKGDGDEERAGVAQLVDPTLPERVADDDADVRQRAVQPDPAVRGLQAADEEDDVQRGDHPFAEAEGQRVERDPHEVAICAQQRSDLRQVSFTFGVRGMTLLSGTLIRSR